MSDDLLTPSMCDRCATYLTGGILCPDCYDEEIERLEGLMRSHDICPNCGDTMWHEYCASIDGCTSPRVVLLHDGTWGSDE